MPQKRTHKTATHRADLLPRFHRLTVQIINHKYSENTDSAPNGRKAGIRKPEMMEFDTLYTVACCPCRDNLAISFWRNKKPVQ